MVILVLLTLLVSFILISLKEEGRIKKEYVEYIFVLHQSLTFDKVGVIGLIVAIATVLVSFRKEYYLVFSIEDVLERFQFKEKVQSIIYAVIGSGIFAILEGIITHWNEVTKKENISGAQLQTTLIVPEVLYCSVVLSNIFLLVYSLWLGVGLCMKILNILFSKEQSELELLNNLYYKIKNRNFLIKNHLEVSMNAILMNGEYLYDQYREAYHNIRNKQMYDVKLRTIFDDDVINKIAKKKLLKSFAIMLIAGVVISIFVEIPNIITENVSKEIVVYYGVYFIIGMVYILLFRIINADMRSVFYRMVLSESVYLYNNKKQSFKLGKCFRKWKNKNQEEKVHVVSLDSDKSESKYFKAILNLAVYLKIISCNKEQKDVSKYIRYIHSLTIEDEDEKSNGKENAEGQRDYMKYIINIYYDFFRYLAFDKERGNILKEIRKGLWFNYLDKLWKKKDFEADKIIKAICLHTWTLLKTEIQPKKPDEKITDEERAIEEYWNEFKQKLYTNKK